MHLLASTTATLDDLAEPVDLAQEPADIAILSFTDSDLGALAAAYRAAADALPSIRLAHLRDLRHPMSVDLWIERVGRHAKVIVARVLGGYDWWRYGVDQLAAAARTHGVLLACLPGEDRADDARLSEASTLPDVERATLLAYLREGGPQNMGALLMRLAALAGAPAAVPALQHVPRAGLYRPGHGVVDRADWRAVADPNAPMVPILFYRSALLAGDVAPIDALVDALQARGLAAIPIFVASLKDAESLAVVRDLFLAHPPAVIVTTTAFASDGGAVPVFPAGGPPVLQAVIATTRREAWRDNVPGLLPADLAMHVCLPELDGRILAGALSFKAETAPDAALGFRAVLNTPEPDRVLHVADRIAALARLQTTPRPDRRVAILLPDYPGSAGRAGYAVGLDGPESVRAALHDLAAADYAVRDIPATSHALMSRLETDRATLDLKDYRAHMAALPTTVQDALAAAWGDPADDPDVQYGAFRFRVAQFGTIAVALAPDRGRAADRRADFHDPALPPRHALVAFGYWLRAHFDAHALVHMGAHGTLEWLPGKVVALSATCFPEIVTGALPVIYPFLVSNPGEAAQAKRRIAAVTLGHLPPPRVGPGLDGPAQDLERLVDEYAQADGLDRRRRARLAQAIVETARRSGLADHAGVAGDADADTVLMRIDAWLCDLKEVAVKDGQHVFGRHPAHDADPMRRDSATAERAALIAALDGRHIAPGPSGAPMRGRRDVMPTGRNLTAADPRAIPTPTAFDLGRMAADETVRAYRQEHGDDPHAVMIDLWGSASLRTGGEEIAHGLALMGCRPVWDGATGRVTGIEVLPPAVMGRPRVDVTWRISGLFRDMFSAQIAMMDAAARAVAARDEADDENPLAAASRRGEASARVFGSAPGTYGAGIEAALASGDWATRDDLGALYVAAGSHVFGGATGEGVHRPELFAPRIAASDALVHIADDPDRDLLEGSADSAFIGGFAAAAAMAGSTPDLVVLDTSDPARPRARPLKDAVARVVLARALNPRFIAGQMRHGPRGASELLETVDRLIAFAETTHVVSSDLIDRVYEAYWADADVRDFLRRENPAAERAMARRFEDALRRSLWHPRRNDIDLSAATESVAVCT